MIMQTITNYSDQDVLCGRGGGTLRHPGNKKVCARQLDSVHLRAFNNGISELTTSFSRSLNSIDHSLDRAKQYTSSPPRKKRPPSVERLLQLYDAPTGDFWNAPQTCDSTTILEMPRR